MNNDPSDYQRIRAYAEERLKPMLRLRRQRTIWFIHMLIFMVTNFLIYATADSPLLFNIQDHQYTDNGAQGWFWTSTPYPLTIIVSLIWFVGLIIHLFSVTVAFRDESAIQREMSKATEFEKLRLSIELARLGRTVDEPLLQTSQWKNEKPKRTVSLTDDGELVANDELPDKLLRQNTNQHEG